MHSRSNAILVVMDNSGTAMTGFQPHPGTPLDAAGPGARQVDIPAVCRGMGAEVQVCDPFDLAKTQETLLEMMEGPPGVKVLVLKQSCALSPEKKHHKKFEMTLDREACLGDACGCNRLCTRAFRCPALVWDQGLGKTRIDEVLCAGCGVCASICPQGAIHKKEVA